MHIFTYSFVLIQESCIMPETWILDSFLGKYLKLCLWSLNKRKTVSWRNFFVPSLCVKDELSVVKMVTNKSALYIVEERLNWTKELFCWSYVKLLHTSKEWLENNCVQCYLVLPQLQLNPQRTVCVTSFQRHSVFCSSSNQTETSVLVCAVNWGLVWIGFVCVFSRWLLWSLCSAPLALPIISSQKPMIRISLIWHSHLMWYKLLSSIGSSFTFHFIPRGWEFRFIFQVYLYVLLKIHIYIYFVYFVMSLTQMNVNAQMEFTRSSSLNF